MYEQAARDSDPAGAAQRGLGVAPKQPPAIRRRAYVRTSLWPFESNGKSTPVPRHNVAPRVFDYATYFKSKENLVPESRTRKSAAEKQKLKTQREQRPKKIKPPASRRWVPPTFIAVGLLGVAWLITYYIAGTQIPFMDALGNWNILIGMSGMAAAFVIATLWR